MRIKHIIAAVLAFGLLGAAAGAGTATATAAPSCRTSGLIVWLDTMGGGAAGSFYWTLEFTNASGHTCTLFGYPGISGISLSGRQLGSAGVRNSFTKPKVVTLSNGATASALLRVTDVGVFSPSFCHPALAAGFRVYPPNQTVSKVVPFPYRACSRPKAIYLGVEALRPAAPGTGGP